MKNISKIYIFLIVLFISMSFVSAENNTEINAINNKTNELNIGENFETEDEIEYDVGIVDKNIHDETSSSSQRPITYFSVLKNDIVQGNPFVIILKTPKYNANGKIDDLGGMPLANKQVTFLINGVHYDRITDSNGIAKITINLSPGEYDFEYSFNGDSEYSPSESYMRTKVFKGDTYFKYLTANIYKTEPFKVALFDSDGNRLSNKKVTLTIHGVDYQRTTNSNGMVNLTINLDPGTFNIDYSFSGENGYSSCSGSTMLNVSTKKVNIIPITLAVVTKAGNTYKVKLTDEFNKPIANKNVVISILDADTYIRKTDSEGIANLNINLGAKQHTFTVSYVPEANSMYEYNSIQHVFTATDLGSKPVQIIPQKTYIKTGTALTVKITDQNKNPLANKKVIIYASGYEYKRTTNNNGEVSLTFNWDNPKTYGISISFMGDNEYEASGIYKLIYVSPGNMNDEYTPNPNADYTVMYDYQKSDYLKETVASITVGCNDDLEKTVAIYDLARRMEYRGYWDGFQNAHNAFMSFEGDCWDQTNVFMSMAKYAGLTVRAVRGTSISLGEGHAWAQVLIDNHWIVADPTNSNTFGKWISTDTFNINRDYPLLLLNDIYVLSPS